MKGNIEIFFTISLIFASRPDVFSVSDIISAFNLSGNCGENGLYGCAYSIEIQYFWSVVYEQYIRSSVLLHYWQKRLVKPVGLANSSFEQIPFYSPLEAFFRYRNYYSIE